MATHSVQNKTTKMSPDKSSPCWITVFGVPSTSEYELQVLKLFARFGKIFHCENSTDTNFMNICFEMSSQAKASLSQDGTFLKPNVIMGVKLSVTLQFPSDAACKEISPESGLSSVFHDQVSAKKTDGCVSMGNSTPSLSVEISRFVQESKGQEAHTHDHNYQSFANIEGQRLTTARVTSSSKRETARQQISSDDTEFYFNDGEDDETLIMEVESVSDESEHGEEPAKKKSMVEHDEQCMVIVPVEQLITESEENECKRGRDIKNYKSERIGKTIYPCGCADCGKNFSLETEVETDLTSHVPQKAGKREQLLCEHCAAAFTNKQRLEAHKNSVHTSLRPLKCDQCDQRFATKERLKVHQRWHTGERPYSCDLCDKKYRDTTALCRHKKEHAGTLKIRECEVCGKCYPDMYHLNLHKKTHLFLHACNKCPKSFAKIGMLENHKLIHKGKKLFTCDICNRHFLKQKRYKEHYANIHRPKTSDTQL